MSKQHEESNNLRLYWEKKLAEWQVSGKSGIAWCKEQNISYHTFRHWKRQILLSSKTPKLPRSFVELTEEKPTKSTQIRLAYQDVIVYLDQDFDEKVLRKILCVCKEL